MKRGDIWTVASGGGYAQKPRPMVIIQNDSFDVTESVTVCTFTTNSSEAPLFRLPVEPSKRNGLHSSSRLMVDKITTIPKSKAGQHIGQLDTQDMLRLNHALMVFLGLASPATNREEG